MNILHLLAASTNPMAIDKMNYVLSKWPDLLEKRSIDNYTPLALAIVTENQANMIHLHQNGADLNVLCSHGMTIDIDNNLNYNPIDKNNDKGVPTLHLASLMQYLDCGKATVEYILANTNYTIDQPALTNYTPLLYAALHGNDGMMKYFWENGANRHHRTDSGLNVLDCAIYSNNIPMVKWLLEQKKLHPAETNQEELYYNLNTIDVSSKWTSFHKSIIFDRLDVAKVLLEYNANPFIVKDIDILTLAGSAKMEEWCKELISSKQ